ncbi:MAG TPA: hypothetical protein GX513_12245 [Firmicutes bacterium]|nr:hypothetical protein [Bacillota bacterium]
MWEEVLAWAMKSGLGVFVVLFITLLAWVLKTNDAREQRYIAVVERQAQALSNFQQMRGDLGEVKDDIRELREWLWQAARNGKAHGPAAG